MNVSARVLALEKEEREVDKFCQDLKEHDAWYERLPAERRAHFWCECVQVWHCAGLPKMLEIPLSLHKDEDVLRAVQLQLKVWRQWQGREGAAHELSI